MNRSDSQLSRRKPLVVLNGLLPQEMADLFELWGLRSYRARQVLGWIHRHGALSFQEMTNISKEDRSFLRNHARIDHLKIAARQRASDGTVKWLMRLPDGLGVETVLIPEGDYWTQCVSTQVGCAMKCRFCRTARLGLIRDLDAWEIVDQVIAARRWFHEGRIRNIVLMGMGEPLANFEAVVRAVRLFLVPDGLDFSKRRVTLSTCGLIPQMRRLTGEDLGINLAVSLNATTDELRSHLMPINKTYALGELLATCRGLRLSQRGRITFQYILYRGVNDSLDDARRLIRLLKGIRCKVNLIPHNPYPGSEFETPAEGRILAFQRILTEAHFTAPIRWSHGAEISAACGQLAADMPAMEALP